MHPAAALADVELEQGFGSHVPCSRQLTYLPQCVRRNHESDRFRRTWADAESIRGRGIAHWMSLR